MVLNPFKPVRIPYYAVPYEHNPYSFFGVGIAENMDDTQTLMNGFMRMAIDNALSGNLIMEVDETNLVPGQAIFLYIREKYLDDISTPFKSSYFWYKVSKRSIREYATI